MCLCSSCFYPFVGVPRPDQQYPRADQGEASVLRHILHLAAHPYVGAPDERGVYWRREPRDLYHVPVLRSSQRGSEPLRERLHESQRSACLLCHALIILCCPGSWCQHLQQSQWFLYCQTLSIGCLHFSGWPASLRGLSSFIFSTKTSSSFSMAHLKTYLSSPAMTPSKALSLAATTSA